MSVELAPAPRPAAAPSAGAPVVVVLGPGEVRREMAGRLAADDVLTDRLLAWATARARSRGAPLRLVTVADVPPGERFGDHASTSYPMWWALRAVLDRVADRLGAGSGEIDVEAELRPGTWPAVLADEMATAALVLVATGGDAPPEAGVPGRCPVVALSPRYAGLPVTWAGVHVPAWSVVESDPEVPQWTTC